MQFKIHENNTNLNFYTGPSSSNPDNVFHAKAKIDANKVATVGFEDLYGGGDRDYNDLMFSVTDVSDVRISKTSEVPEPASLGMLAGGLGLIGYMSKRRKKTA